MLVMTHEDAYEPTDVAVVEVDLPIAVWFVVTLLGLKVTE